VIISDLQYIESATESEVKGGKCRRPSCWYDWHAHASVEPGFFDTDAETFTSTDTLILEDQFSNSEF
jgi:hypothetical protein